VDEQSGKQQDFTRRGADRMRKTEQETEGKTCIALQYHSKTIKTEPNDID
jgi:hypothetical protein